MIGVFWLFCGICASFAGPTRYSTRLFFMTFLFMGPVGVAAALIMTAIDDYATRPPQGRKIAEGRRRFTCPRCGADSDIPDKDTSYECWQCGVVRKIKPKATTASEGEG